MIKFIPTKLVKKIRRTLEQRHPRGPIVIVYQAPPGTQQPD